LRLLMAVPALLLAPGPARGHDLDSASLSLTEQASGRFLVGWRASSATLQEDLASAVVFPAPCHLRADLLDCGAAAVVGPMEFPWLEGTLTRVMVDVEWRSGARLLRVVTAGSPRLRVYGVAASGGLRALAPIVVDYTRLGVEHILTGFDHLLFVVA